MEDNIDINALKEQKQHDDNQIFYVNKCKLIPYSQVSPTEVEGVLSKHPLVADVAITSVPCEMAGELPQAWVVRKDNTLTENMVKKIVAGMYVLTFRYLLITVKGTCPGLKS